MRPQPKDKETAEQGAGDQGIMFGYACDETPELMPAPIAYSHKLGAEITRLRKDRVHTWLRPDSKTQVSMEYVDGQPDPGDCCGRLDHACG